VRNVLLLVGIRCTWGGRIFRVEYFIGGRGAAKLVESVSWFVAGNGRVFATGVVSCGGKFPWRTHDNY
jgi:hypothetical protein